MQFGKLLGKMLLPVFFFYLLIPANATDLQFKKNNIIEKKDISAKDQDESFYPSLKEIPCKLSSALIKTLKKLNPYASLIAALMTFFAVLVALYLGSWKQKIERPKLGLGFNEKKDYPYCATLSFGRFRQKN